MQWFFLWGGGWRLRRIRHALPLGSASYKVGPGLTKDSTHMMASGQGTEASG